MFFTTCTSTSRPTMSAVRNVADFGHPTAGPVHASTSSTVIPSVPIKRSALSIENVPMRLAMKFGVSFAITTPLPSLLSQKSLSVSTTSLEVFAPGMTSTNLRYRGGLKKCVPAQCCWNSSLMPSAMKCTGNPDVLVVKIAPGFRNCATRASKFRLISRFSATTSMIQSASAQRARSSSKFPIAILSASDAVKNADGFDFFAASNPARTILLRSAAGAPAGKFGGTISSKMHGRPAFAKCAAIREPIVPAPSTTAFSIRRFMESLFRKSDGRTGYKTSIPRSNQMPTHSPSSSKISAAMLEDKVTNALDWLRNAKDKFRSFATNEERLPTERPRVGLALAGGYARGIAHVGVIRALVNADIPIDCVAGTSVGALIGACYCAGVPLEDMQRIASATSFADFGRWTPSWLGLATNQRMETYFSRFTHLKTFEELKTPLAIAATDINAGISVYYTRGQITPALRGSCAYPGLFVPIQFEGRTLVDGFLTAPVPVEGALLLGADVVIAIYLEAGNLEDPRTFT